MEQVHQRWRYRCWLLDYQTTCFHLEWWSGHQGNWDNQIVLDHLTCYFHLKLLQTHQCQKINKKTRKQTCNLLSIPCKPSETVFYSYIYMKEGAIQTVIFDSLIWLNPWSFANHLHLKKSSNLVFISIFIIHSRRTPVRKYDIQLCTQG